MSSEYLKTDLDSQKTNFQDLNFSVLFLFVLIVTLSIPTFSEKAYGKQVNKILKGIYLVLVYLFSMVCFFL